MKMNDGMSADVRVGKLEMVDNASACRKAGVELWVDGDGSHVMSAGDACRLLEVLYGCAEQAVVLCERPIALLHSLECGPAYMLHRVVDGKPDEQLAVIRPHEAIWLKLKLEQAVSACD